MTVRALILMYEKCVPYIRKIRCLSVYQPVFLFRFSQSLWDSQIILDVCKCLSARRHRSPTLLEHPQLCLPFGFGGGYDVNKPHYSKTRCASVEQLARRHICQDKTARCSQSSRLPPAITRANDFPACLISHSMRGADTRQTCNYLHTRH